MIFLPKYYNKENKINTSVLIHLMTVLLGAHCVSRAPLVPSTTTLVQTAVQVALQVGFWNKSLIVKITTELLISIFLCTDIRTLDHYIENMVSI